MYTLVKGIQYLGILIMIWGFFRLYSQKLSEQKQLVMSVLCAVLLNQAGYALELNAVNLEAALVSVKIAYAGKLMAELGVFLFVMVYCKVRIPQWLRYVLLTIHLGIIGLVWTCEKHTLYYKSISFTKDGLYPHLVLEYGFFYDFLMLLTFGYMTLMFGASLKCLIRAEKGMERTRVIFMLIVPVTFVAGLGILRSGITNGYDTTAPAYVISVILMITALLKYDLINEEELAKDIIIDELSDPVFVLDPKGKIVYMNSRFVALFAKGDPELDEKMANQVIMDCLEDKEYEQDGLFYQIQEKKLVQDGLSLGYIYILHDVTESKKRLKLVHTYNEQLEHDVDEKTKHLKEMQHKLVLDMADLMEGRDPSTGGHIKRTSMLIEIFMDQLRQDESLNLDDEFCECLIKAAPMHDLGKMVVGDDVLKKPGRYTQEEYEKMKRHAEKGAEIVHQFLERTGDERFREIAENVAHYHHERFDGSGYPKHLKGEEIPLEARIMAIVDVYDALVSKRCYKDKMSYADVDEVILKGMGTKFDPQFKMHYLEARKEFEKYYNSRAMSA